MSSISSLNPSNHHDVTYEACPSWCEYRDDPGLHEFGHCTRTVRNRELLGMTIGGCYAGITVSAATARMPRNAPREARQFAIRHYLNGVQIITAGVGFEVVFDLSAGDARSYAASLIRAADLVEGLDR